jgi:putative sigma-54 modulation protein
MQLNFTGHSLEVTPALKDLVNSKFEKIQRHFDHITSANVTFSVQKLENLAEITIHVPGHQLHSSGKADDMYKAIDEMISGLDRQIIKHKEKLKNHKVIDSNNKEVLEDEEL